MIAITSKTYDLLGYLQISGRSERKRKETRRLVVSGTLDGGTVIDDLGYSEGDNRRDYVLYTPSENDLERAFRLVTVHDEHFLFTSDGAYSGTVEDVDYTDPPELVISFQIEEKLTT